MTAASAPYRSDRHDRHDPDHRPDPPILGGRADRTAPSVRPVGPDRDTVRAFLHDPSIAVPPSGPGPLDGLACGVKDAFDIAGTRTGYGNPAWRGDHPPAAAHADAVARLLDHGAAIVGKTHTDELAFSLTGDNAHYGAPINPAAPDRFTGGSSCGSAAAVAAGLCEVALGTDTGGSVRAPASFCGLYGIRTTHDAVSRAGVCALAPSFDTVGWFARDARTLARVGDVLLPPDAVPPGDGTIAFFETAWRLVDAADAEGARARALASVQRLGEARTLVADSAVFGRWFDAFRTLQFAEVAGTLGPWVARRRPPLGPGIAERIAAARGVTRAEVEAADAVRAAATRWLDEVFVGAEFVALPTVPGAAPRRHAPIDAMERYRRTAMRLLSLAGLSGCPQVTLPQLRAEGLPMGWSLIGRRGSDRRLLEVACAAG